MPLTDTGRVVPVIIEEGSYSASPILDQGSPVTVKDTRLESWAPAIPAREDTISCRRAHCGWWMSISESHSFSWKAVKVRGRNCWFWIKSTDVSEPHIISHDKNYIRPLFWMYLTNTDSEEEKNNQKRSHISISSQRISWWQGGFFLWKKI